MSDSIPPDRARTASPEWSSPTGGEGRAEVAEVALLAAGRPMPAGAVAW